MKLVSKESFVVGRVRNSSLLELYTGSDLISNPNFSEIDVQEEYGNEPRTFGTYMEALRTATALNERIRAQLWEVYRMKLEPVE